MLLTNQSILKEISPGCSLEGLMLKLKLQYFGHMMWRTDSSEKTLMLGKTEGRRRRKGATKDEMVGCNHRSDGHEFEQALGVGDEQGSLACCSPWACRVRHNWVTALNWTELSPPCLIFLFFLPFFFPPSSYIDSGGVLVRAYIITENKAICMKTSFKTFRKQ